MTKTNYKQLCADLIDALDSGIPPARIRNSPLANRARAELAESEPQRRCLYSPAQIAECGGPCRYGPEHCDCGELCVTEPASEPKGQTPSDEELELLADCHMITDGQTGAVSLEHLDYARAVLARWGNHQGILDSSTLQPVPVSERPWERKEWCDEQGRCWWLDSADSCWVFDDPETCRHWASFALPAHALPLPTHE